LDSSSENRTSHNEQPQQGVPAAPGATGVKKEREPKDDGRYIIFYTFEGEKKSRES
jgi:hypothetical protein